MTRILLLLGVALLLAACAVSEDGDARAFEQTQIDFASGMRWNGLATQTQFLDPEVLKANPPSAQTMARMRELRVARYFPQPPAVSAGGTATQLVEIEVIDQATQTVSTINQVLEWRWDMEDRRWWLMTPPPDLGAED